MSMTFCEHCGGVYENRNYQFGVYCSVKCHTEAQEKLRHACPEFDGLVIDKNDPEFETCICFKERKQ